MKLEADSQKTELKVLDKIDLSQIESSRPKPSKKSEAKKEKTVAKKKKNLRLR